MSDSEESNNSDELVDIRLVDQPEICLTEAELGCPLQNFKRAILGFIKMQSHLLIPKFGLERFEKFAAQYQEDSNDKDPDQEIVDFLLNLRV